jgi:hypothetical protein
MLFILVIVVKIVILVILVIVVIIIMPDASLLQGDIITVINIYSKGLYNAMI